jgi:hypothetical protein
MVLDVIVKGVITDDVALGVMLVLDRTAVVIGGVVGVRFSS